MNPPEWLANIALHPRILLLGQDAAEQRRIDAFARDLAHYLWGAPRDTLGALARVVTVVAQRDLRDARLLCRDRPLLAVEAAARATEVLWPLLRRPPEPEGATQHESPPDHSGDGDGPQAPAEALPGLDGDEDLDPELQHLAEQLSGEDESDRGEQAADLLEGFGSHASQGAVEADELAQHIEDFLPGIGWSHAPGQLERTLLDRIQSFTDLVRDLPSLRELAEHLGRLDDASRGEGPTHGGREEVVGVHLGGEVAHALPMELALLGDPSTEDLFHQRVIERRLLSLELTGHGDDGQADGEKRGPVIACIDTSGSMEGDPEMLAKALVLSVCRSLLPQGRTVHLLLFGGQGEQTEIRVKKGVGGLEALLAFLGRGFHGGTDFDGPLLRALELLEERDLQRADILVVTDGLCRAGSALPPAVESARVNRGVRVWSVVLGREDVRGVAPFSDRVWTLLKTRGLRSLDLTEVLRQNPHL